MKLKPAILLSLLFLMGTGTTGTTDNANASAQKSLYFTRTATFPVCSQIDAACNTDKKTAAEIVAASSDKMTLIYTDSPMNRIGFVNIADPKDPKPIGTLALSGEPTSIAVHGAYALVAVNTSKNYVDAGGELAIVDIAAQTLVHTITLDGQPDSIAVSPDGAYAGIVIENERNEDLNDGALPQLPAGTFDIITLSGNPTEWMKRVVDMTGLAAIAPNDPEPEYVDINADNIAVVTLQENNHIVLVDLATGHITNHFSAGTVDLSQVDTAEEDPALISQTASLASIPREPDGVSWINTTYFATADEGDFKGGGRGFTIYDTKGNVVFSSGNTLEHMAARLGHYPDARSKNKGNEPENVEFGRFNGRNYLFVNSERSSLVFVYEVSDPVHPVYVQTLPAATAPEGALAIPSRNLLIVASEKDKRKKKMRAGLNIYSYSEKVPKYPTLQSADRPDGTPIPWGAMSGLSADPGADNLLYAVEDSFYGKNRIFTINTATAPATLTAEIRIQDANDVFASIAAATLTDPSVDSKDPSRATRFDEADLRGLINKDKTVNIDPEGIAKASDGGFWIASEGSGTIGDAKRPVNSLNFIFKTDAQGIIQKVISLPGDINAKQLRFGFEGIAEYNGNVYVAFQRAWAGDSHPRIGIYNTAAGTWQFLYYPLDTPESQRKSWVGLSDLTAIGNGEFLVLERDNQGGPDAAVKRIYRISTNGLADGALLTKTRVRDLMGDLSAPGGLIYEKVEGLAKMSNGDVWIMNDNDGIDNSSGETQLINLGNILN